MVADIVAERHPFAELLIRHTSPGCDALSLLVAQEQIVPHQQAHIRVQIEQAFTTCLSLFAFDRSRQGGLYKDKDNCPAY